MTATYLMHLVSRTLGKEGQQRNKKGKEMVRKCHVSSLVGATLQGHRRLGFHTGNAKLLWATSHTRLRAHDPYTSSTLIGGKGGFASHYARGTIGVCECTMDVKSTWIPTWHKWIAFQDHLDYTQNPTLVSKPNTKPRNHGTPNIPKHWFIIFYNDDPHE